MIKRIARLIEKWEQKSIRRQLKKQIRKELLKLEKRHDALCEKAGHYEALAILEQDAEMEALANLTYRNQMMVKEMIDENKRRFFIVFGEEV